jgi:sugar O-acyltransferase (sialic acid O-acetyltransferase NeuD family)
MVQSFIIGTGGFAAEVYEWLEASDNPFDFGGFVSKDSHDSSPIENAVCICDAELPSDQEINLYLAIGNPMTRKYVVESVLQVYPLAKFPNLVHPTAIIGNFTKMGKGNLILPYSILCPRSSIGSFNIMNLYSSIGHDAAIGNFCTLSPYATLNGSAECSDQVFVGSHATVASGVKLENAATLSANSLATKNIQAEGLAFGVPAKSLNSGK